MAGRPGPDGRLRSAMRRVRADARATCRPDDSRGMMRELRSVLPVSRSAFRVLAYG